MPFQSRSVFACLCGLLLALFVLPSVSHSATFEVKPLTEEQAKEYTLDLEFYKKGTLVQNILIVTSGKVPDVTHHEAAYLFDQLLSICKPEIAQRVRDRRVLCIIVGHDEQVSDLPQYKSDKTGKDLDFYNWRNRGFLEMNKNGHPTVLFTEEDVMEYEGGMQNESILIHEFAMSSAALALTRLSTRNSMRLLKRSKKKGSSTMVMRRRSFVA